MSQLLSFNDYRVSSDAENVVGNMALHLDVNSNACIQESFNKTRIYIQTGFFHFLSYFMALYSIWYGVVPIVNKLLMSQSDAIASAEEGEL